MAVYSDLGQSVVITPCMLELMQPGHMCCMLSHVPCRPCLLSHLSTVPVISYVGVWPFWANFIVAVFFSAISLQLIAEIFYSCIILLNKHLLFTYFLVSPDQPNDRWKSWGSFHCKKKGGFDTLISGKEA